MSGSRIALIDELKRLKEDCNAVAIKAEFEAEGARKDELIMLREFLYQADMDFIIKIGGCEAVHDLDQCRLLNATGIMAPMIETPFAMNKFKNAAHKVYGSSLDSVDWIINAETKTCLQNYDEILKEGQGFLTGVTVGRSDLSASMGIDAKDIESNVIFDAAYLMLSKSKKAGLKTNFGGKIGLESIPFITKMGKVIDRFETRKVVLCANDNDEALKKAIYNSLKFEVDYLKFKAEYYDTMAREDESRIVRLSKELERYGQ